MLGSEPTTDPKVKRKLVQVLAAWHSQFKDDPSMAFVANLFNTHPGLEPLTEAPPEPVEDFDAEGEREARVFTLWLNSIGVEPGVYNLFEDVKVSRFGRNCSGS